MVFGVREPVTGPEWRGFPELVVGGLADVDAAALLDAVVPGRLDEHVRDRIVAETRGNPLALLELPRGLTAAELAGGFERPDARPLASQIEQNFARRVQSLPPHTQRLLLTAAAEPVGDVPLLLRALAILDVPVERGRACRGGRSDRARCAGPVPASAGAVGDVPGGGCRPTAGESIRPSPRRSTRTSIPTGAPGTAPTERTARTRTSPPNWSAPPTGPSAAAVSRPRPRSCNGRPS